MPTLPSNPEIHYSARNMADFMQLMGRFAAGEFAILANAAAAAASPRAHTEAVHLFTPFDAENSGVLTAALGDGIFPLSGKISLRAYGDLADYAADWARPDGLPEIIDGQFKGEGPSMYLGPVVPAE